MSQSRGVAHRYHELEQANRMTTSPPVEHGEWVDTVRLATSIADPVKWGYSVIAGFVFVFVLWGAVVPIAGGALAPGVVNPEGNRKVVQHLEGGIIHALLVKDGDVVAAGQPLVELADIQAKSGFDMLKGQRRGLIARQARLDAEKHNRNRITFPAELATKDRETQELVQSQIHLFDTRRARYVTRQNVLRQRIVQLEEQIKGYNAQLASVQSQRSMIREEVEAKDTLLQKGYVSKPEALRLRRMEADMGGRQGELVASVARTHQQIGEARIELLSLEAERADQIAAEQDKISQELGQVVERLQASQDVLERTVITAPVGGTVVNLKFKNVKAVVQRGEPILEIVPSNDKLLIEARVSPADIDIVHGGLAAQVHFSAYASRQMPRIFGTVISVSADRLMESGTQKSYYLAKVEIDRDELKSRAPWIQLIPGMPADVLIVTEARSMLGYLLKPFRDAMRRSFREA